MIKGFVKLIVILVILYFVFTHLSALASFLSGISGPGGVPLAQAANHSSTLVMGVARLDQNSLSQYSSAAEYNAWSPSACAAASTAAVLNFYEGRNIYRVHDMLQVLRDNGDITTRAGLLSYAAFLRLASHFHYHATLNDHDTLSHIIAVAQSGHPVIVNWPPDRWPGGHFLVVRGGNASIVYLTDSSSFAYPSLSREKFSTLWAGFSAVLTPY